ncbi:MAG: biotin--[acetyl-CoA-carboxylase] ligase, partial [Variovorax sp.]
MRWPAEAVWEQVAPGLPGFTVEVLPEVASTNTELMRRARAGQLDPILLVAERQTAGRGRLGRTWQSSPGDSLTFSFGLRLDPADWSGLSLAVGVAVAGALHPAIRLKWPNDLWLDDHKLGGILIETAPAPAGGRYAIVGVGLNIAPRAAEGLSTPPAALRDLLPDLGAGDALVRAVPALAAALARFEQGGFAAFQP